MKKLFIISALIIASLCSCIKGSELVILAAEEAEYNKCREIFPEIECIRTGVGAGNVIKACCNLPKGTRIINIGYAGSSFFTESDRANPTLYDMELNYIASFSPHLELVAAVKIVSDNLSVDAFLNNAIRESGVLTSDEVWANVRQAVETILSRNQDKKR